MLVVIREPNAPPSSASVTSSGTQSLCDALGTRRPTITVDCGARALSISVNVRPDTAGTGGAPVAFAPAHPSKDCLIALSTPAASNTPATYRRARGAP